jgi:hypothetical protein
LCYPNPNSNPNPNTNANPNTNPKYYPNPILNGTDFGAEIGVGLSFYLRYAIISPEVKFSYGLRDLKKVSTSIPLLSNLDKVSSNFVYFTIHIEN